MSGLALVGSGVDGSGQEPAGRDVGQRPRATVEPLAAFAELGRIDLSDVDLDQVLAKVAQLAQEVIPAAAAVSVTLVSDGLAGTAASTADAALAIDQSQYEAGSGPCLDAAADHGVRVVDDMAQESRWPVFASAAATHGIQSSLSVGISLWDGVSGALNIYASAPGAFGPEEVVLGQTFAGYAAVALGNAHLYSTTTALAGQMAEAMQSRAVIEQAKGLLIGRHRVSADEAFAMLSRASQNSNRKLRDIAQALIDGAQPDVM
jgi:GAF domain-containing protein